MDTFHTSLEKFYLALALIVALVYLLDVYVTNTAHKKGIAISNKYYSIQKHYGFLLSGVVKLLLVMFIIYELIDPTLNVGRSAMLAAAYLCLAAKMAVDFFASKAREHREIKQKTA